MPKRFDTNPLDPEFPEKAKAAAQTGSAGGYTAPRRTPYSTGEFADRPPSVTEDETRRFNEAQFPGYAFEAGHPPAVYQPAIAPTNQPGDRKVARTGVPEKWLIGLPYVPWIGLVAGLILLLVIPKEENKVRFHAAQGFAMQLSVLVISQILSGVGGVTGSNIGGSIFDAITTVLMIVWAIKAWKGKPVHIEAIEDLTNWFEEKIGPIKS